MSSQGVACIHNSSQRLLFKVIIYVHLCTGLLGSRVMKCASKIHNEFLAKPAKIRFPKIWSVISYAFMNRLDAICLLN